MLNYNFVHQKARESQIDINTIEREYWQLLFLQQLYADSRSSQLYFKGGTAIHFLLQSFRFSEDLDFTSTMLAKDIEELITDVYIHFKKYHVALELKKEHVHKIPDDASLKYRLLFQPQNSTQKMSIRIDVSLREKPLTKHVTVMTPFDYPIMPYPLVVHLSTQELMAEKIRALLKRNKPRDVFDIWFLLTKKIPVNEALVQEKLTIYPDITYSKVNVKNAIEQYTERELRLDLNQFLPQMYRNMYTQMLQQTIELIGQ